MDELWKDVLKAVAGKLTAGFAFAILVIVVIAQFGGQLPSQYQPLPYILTGAAYLVYAIREVLKARQAHSPKHQRTINVDGNVEKSVLISGDTNVVDVQFAKTELEEIHESLEESVNALRNKLGRQIRKASQTPPEEPYRYLNYFELKHKSVFYGRESDQEALLDKICGDGREKRLTLLHAPSGAGKTSLLQAAIVPALYDRGALPVYIHHPREPVETIKKTLLPAAPHPEKFEKLPLLTTLSWATQYLERDEELIILLDQFEEFFIHCSGRQQQPFINGLADCYYAENLPVKFVLAMRKDYFSDMDKFSQNIEAIFRNRYLLSTLTRTDATRAIQEPLRERNIAWHPDTVERLLDYLEEEDIEISHVQLICSRLYASAKEANRTVINAEGDDLEAIHANYLEEEMAAFSPPVYTLEQRDLAWNLLKELVTSGGTKQELPIEKLYELAPKEDVDPVLARLVNRRLLRRDKNEIHQHTTVEVSHDKLAEKIQAYESPQEIRVKAARELINRGLNDWLSHERRPLLSSTKLRILDEYSDVLEPPILGKGTAEKEKREQKALEYLLRSALAEEQQAAYWYDLAQQGGLNAEAILLERLKSDDYKERAATLNVYGQIGKEENISLLIERLADEYPQVRAAAIQTLEILQPSGEWRKHLVHECYVPAGEFMMGNDYGDSDEKPAHPVTVDAFYIAKTPVTNAAYKRYADDRGIAFEIPDGKANHPVVNVSWYQAKEYASWAMMRLPTEAQWEKAASWDDGKGVKRKYPWGNNFDQNRCNTIESDIIDTTPVDRYGDKGASPCGAWDMAGNVWEWCSSLFKDYPYVPEDGRENPSDSDSRVLRGGSFNSLASYARCAARYDNHPDFHWDNLGFRVCLVGASPISRSSS